MIYVLGRAQRGPGISERWADWTVGVMRCPDGQDIKRSIELLRLLSFPLSSLCQERATSFSVDVDGGGFTLFGINTSPEPVLCDILSRMNGGEIWKFEECRSVGSNWDIIDRTLHKEAREEKKAYIIIIIIAKHQSSHIAVIINKYSSVSERSIIMYNIHHVNSEREQT
jgi:hypothetical protein